MRFLPLLLLPLTTLAQVGLVPSGVSFEKIGFEGSMITNIIASSLSAPVLTLYTTNFTASGTWGWPTGVTNAYVQCWGGGGGAGGADTSGGASGGGKGGGWTTNSFDKSQATVSVIVGAAGTAGAAQTPAGNGGDGGPSYIYQGTTTNCLATGGGGSLGKAGTGAGAGATNQIGVAIGSLSYAGGNGTNGVAASYGGGGGGAAGSTGVGGAASANTGGNGTAYNPGTGNGGGGVTSANGTAGSDYGGAGGGTRCNNTTDRAGGAGKAGYVQITWYQ